MTLNPWHPDACAVCGRVDEHAVFCATVRPLLSPAIGRGLQGAPCACGRLETTKPWRHFRSRWHREHC